MIISKKSILFLVFIFTCLVSANSQSFQNTAIAVGIDTTYGLSFFGGSTSFVDFNQDGYDDLTFSTDLHSKSHFYLNNGDGTFTKLPSLIPDTTLGRQILWVDYDNDQDLDIFLSVHPEASNPIDGQNKLYRNDGDLEFTDVTSTAGLVDEDTPTYGAAFGDINADGYLDLYSPRYSELDSNRFYLNNGDGTFSDVSNSIGLTDSLVLDFNPVFLDVEGDGDLDIYTIVDRYTMTNRMYLNDGTGNFTDVTATCGAGISINAMNGGVADYDNDGDLDIYVSNTSEGNQLLQNDGDGNFTDVAVSAGVEYGQVAWGGGWMDVDNDRDLDLYVCGILNNLAGRNKLYKNLGDGTFEEYDMGGLPGDSLSSFSNATGDFNHDGMMDIAVSSGANHPLRFWQNMITNDNNWVGVKLQGVESNSQGIGSWVEVYENGFKQVRFTHCGINFLGQNSLEEHFGLGDGTSIDSLIIRWPSGNVDKYLDLEVNQTYVFTEGDCLGSQAVLNPDGNHYIGTDGDLFNEDNWSWGIVPGKNDDAYIESDTPLSLSLGTTSDFTCRSLALVGNVTFTNNGVIFMDDTFFPSIYVSGNSLMINNGQININKPCNEALWIKGSFEDNGSINITNE